MIFLRREEMRNHVRPRKSESSAPVFSAIGSKDMPRSINIWHVNIIFTKHVSLRCLRVKGLDFASTSSSPRRLVEAYIVPIHRIAQPLRCRRGRPSTPRVFLRCGGHVPSRQQDCPDLVAAAALGHWRRGTQQSHDSVHLMT